MFKKIPKIKNAQSSLEYISMIIFILAVFFVFQKYILQAMGGRWKNVGEAFSFGRRYEPGVTTQCGYDFDYHDRWYDLDCFDDNCDCFTTQQTNATCRDCIQGCFSGICDSSGP